MLNKVFLRYHEISEALKDGGIRNALSKRLYYKKTLMPVEMNLENLPLDEDPLAGQTYRLLRLSLDLLGNHTIHYPVKSREHKAVNNLKQGLRGYALLKGHLVVGDIWCACPDTDNETVEHPDLDWLGIKHDKGDAYAFDMYICPDERGNNLAAPFQKATLFALKRDGFRKVYGYYWSDYMPALWMHRMLKWHELGKLQVSRFFSIRKSSAIREAVRR